MATNTTGDGSRLKAPVRAMPARTVVHVLDADVGRLFVTVRALAHRGFVPREYADPECLYQEGFGKGHVILADAGTVGNVAGLARTVAATGDTPVVLLSGTFDVPYVVLAMKAGAYDVLPYPANMDVVSLALNRAAVKAVTARRQNEVDAAPEATREAVDAPLTPREKDVLRCLVLGLTNKRTASLLGISARTVEVHRAHIIAKTRAGTIAALARKMEERNDAIVLADGVVSPTVAAEAPLASVEDDGFEPVPLGPGGP